MHRSVRDIRFYFQIKQSNYSTYNLVNLIKYHVITFSDKNVQDIKISGHKRGLSCPRHPKSMSVSHDNTAYGQGNLGVLYSVQCKKICYILITIFVLV